MQHFEDFVYGHFHTIGCAMLLAYRAYMEGANLGCIVKQWTFLLVTNNDVWPTDHLTF